MDRYHAADTASPVLLTEATWWKGLDDSTLDRLIELALSDNISLAVARERVAAARTAQSQIPPGVTLSTEARANLSGTDGTDTASASAAELGLDWLLDPWGARAAERSAAGSRTIAAEAEFDAARLLVLSELSIAYLELRLRQRLHTLARRERTGRLDTLALTVELGEAGEATNLDITRARARVAEIETNLPDSNASIASTRTRIEILLGLSPGTLPADLDQEVTRLADQPRPTLSPEVGIPADLLRNRPDIRVAEALYAAAVSDIVVARAELFPRLSLGGAITLNAATEPDLEYFFGPVVQFPALPQGPARAGMAEREALARQAYQIWRETVLEAIGEVETALIDYSAATASLVPAAEAVRLYRQARAQTREIYEAGAAVLSDVIDAEDDIAASERREAELIFQQAQAYVTLYTSLGAASSVDTTSW